MEGKRKKEEKRKDGNIDGDNTRLRRRVVHNEINLTHCLTQ